MPARLTFRVKAHTYVRRRRRRFNVGQVLVLNNFPCLAALATLTAAAAVTAADAALGAGADTLRHVFDFEVAQLLVAVRGVGHHPRANLLVPLDHLQAGPGKQRSPRHGTTLESRNERSKRSG